MNARGTSLALMAALLAAPAAADHFTSIDLGPVSDRDSCMAHAERVFGLYARSYGQEAATSRGSWTLSGWDLPPDGADVNILCVEVNGAWNAFATGHTIGDGATPEATIEQYRDLFQK